jgi:hypothetical protein
MTCRLTPPGGNHPSFSFSDVHVQCQLCTRAQQSRVHEINGDSASYEPQIKRGCTVTYVRTGCVRRFAPSALFHTHFQAHVPTRTSHIIQANSRCTSRLLCLSLGLGVGIGVILARLIDLDLQERLDRTTADRTLVGLIA